MKKAQPRETIFCAGNEKLLYPPVVGRRRVAGAIFQTNGFDAEKSKELEIKVSEGKKKIYARRNDQSLAIDSPAGLAKGLHSRDFMSQSMDCNTYGFVSSKKKIEDKDNNQQTKYSQADFSELKYRDPIRKDRIGKILDSTGVKKSLTLIEPTTSIPSTPRKLNLFLSSSGMKEALSTPKNGNYYCLNVTPKVNSRNQDF